MTQMIGCGLRGNVFNFRAATGLCNNRFPINAQLSYSILHFLFGSWLIEEYINFHTV